MSGADYHVEVHGSVGGNLVVGDHNLIVNAQTGSSVTVLQEAERPAPVRRPTVRLLPRRPSVFVGRSTELGAIAAAVVAQSTLQVYGASGVGKSTLLRQAAYAMADETRGIAYLTASGRGGGDVLQEIFEACYETSGHRPSSTELRRYLGGIRVTFFVDDLTVDDDALATILDTVPDAGFVFTSVARELWGQGSVVALAGLPEDQALALFRREFGRELTAAELAAASRAWRETAGSPIGVLRAAAALAATPSEPVIPAPRDSDDPERTVPYPVPLTPPQRDVYDLLRALPQGAIAVPVLTRLVGAPDAAKVEAAADRLDDVGLAERNDDTFRLAEDLAGAAPAAHYRRDAGTLADAMLAWLREGDASASTAAIHGPVIVALVDDAVATGHAAAGCRLARAAAPLLALSLRWDLWRDVLVAGQAAATAADDQESLAYFTHERGIRMLCLGQAATAATVLASAAGMWQALGLAKSALIASNAHAVATAAASMMPAAGSVPAAAMAAPSGPSAPAGSSGSASGSGSTGSSGPAGGSGSAGGSGPASAGSVPVPRPPRPARRFIGRARAPHPKPGFPVVPVVIAGIVVVALIVAGLLYATHGSGPARPVAGPTTASPTPSASVQVPFGPPVASSPFTVVRSDPARVLDNDPSTFWSSTVSKVPQADVWIQIDMQGLGSWTGVSLTPRADGIGFPAGFRLESSVDGVTWTPIPGQDYNADNPPPSGTDAQTLTFGAPVQARYVRLYAYTLGRANAPIAVAEVAPLYALQIAEMHVLG